MERKSERRRRIIERGFERIAFINSAHVDSVEDSASSHLLHTNSSPNNRYNTVDDEFSRETTSDLETEDVPTLSKCGTDTEALRLPLSPISSRSKLPVSRITSRIHKVSSDRKSSLKQHGIHLNLYSLKELNFCIIASETTRVSCSIVIALLVVLSNINLHRNIVQSRSFISSNPLYILLLTDVTIVIGWLTLNRFRFSEKIEEEVRLKEDKEIWGGAFRILEIGLVAHQMVRAVFIDFSFYAVIVVCGFSLL
ncbi:uncharacterized protein LOC112516365 [Cynara cardunculus var. scolymus]|uniref:uncharacterized protein LOC112516365 n=1 Tax=Cynara cardunculus var. scolymus TaxID=59895 RepID=UPI000D62BDCF|nr:uncharacterized protein LOC112516365 [Cynara cardunculus var. scolymus]